MKHRSSRSHGPGSLPPEREGASRRRGAALETALLEAAWKELRAVGYRDFTMDGVAERAGTAKTVLYRRWHNRAELVVAAIRRLFGSVSDQVPDTGSLRGDVLSLLRALRDRYRKVGPDVLHGVVLELGDLPGAQFQIIPDVMMTLLKRAVARGEARVEGVTPRMLALPGDILRHEQMLRRTNVSD
ncbi:MAG TPA: TetR/AcrR family transcriptional regulator, partial [Myxococcales bacterium]|nr:TetR/AcrR family transcriptional regulator [Myxococcales bacterium]